MKKIIISAILLAVFTASLTLTACGHKSQQNAPTGADTTAVAEDSSATEASPLEITSTLQFDKAISTDGLVLVDFWATWCGPCQSMHPIIEQLAKDCSSDIKVLFVDVDQNSELAQRYGLQAIPTFYLFKDGMSVWNYTGTMELEEFKGLIKKYK